MVSGTQYLTEVTMTEPVAQPDRRAIPHKPGEPRPPFTYRGARRNIRFLRLPQGHGNMSHAKRTAYQRALIKLAESMKADKAKT